MFTYPPGVASPARLRDAVRSGDAAAVHQTGRSPKITKMYSPGLLADAARSGDMRILEWAVFRFVLARRVSRDLLVALGTARQEPPSLFAAVPTNAAAPAETPGGMFAMAAWCIRRRDANAEPAGRVLGVRTAAEVAAGAPDWADEIAAAWSAAKNMAWRDPEHSARAGAWLGAVFGGDARLFGDTAPGERKH